MAASESKRLEIGKVMAGVITAVALAVLATTSQLFMSYLAYRSGEENKVAIAEVQETGEKNHDLLNSQKTAMEKKIEDLLVKITALEAVVVEAKTRKEVKEEEQAK